MLVRSMTLGLVGLLLWSASTHAQTQPLRGQEASPGVAEPDQPVQPRAPVLVPRAAEQPGPQQPPKPPFTLSADEQAQVDHVLAQWEKRNRDVKTFDCRFKRWTYDKVFGDANKPKFVDLGVIKYASPDRGLFRIEATERDGTEMQVEPARADYWMCDGKSVFIFAATKKQVIEQKLPPELQGKAISDGPLPFVFGAEADKLKQRYWIRLVPPPGDPAKLVCLLAFPRFQQGAANFHHVEFVITMPDMMPFGLKLVQPGQNESMTYQFYDSVINDSFRLFKADPFRPFVPFGWQKVVEQTPAGQGTQAHRIPNERR
jgi:TIGR03009 family protein